MKGEGKQSVLGRNANSLVSMGIWKKNAFLIAYIFSAKSEARPSAKIEESQECWKFRVTSRKKKNYKKEKIRRRKQ